MANPQVEQGYIRISNELWDEILRRDFSKRQQKIILFIWRLSYGTGQKDCKIDKFNMLELAGMYKTDVKKELKFLRECNVLDWEEKTMVFSINKNYKMWQITPNKNWDSDKFKSLIHQNLSRKKVSKTLTPKKTKVSKTLTFKSEEVSKLLTFKLVKHLPRQSLILRGARYTNSLKTVLKTLKIKDIKDNNNYSNPEVSKTLTNPFTYYAENFERIIPPAIIQKINSWLDDFSEEMVILAMEKTLEQEEYKRKWGYINRILVNWHKNNIKTPEQAKEADEKFYSRQRRASGYAGDNEVVPDWFNKRKGKKQEPAAHTETQEEREEFEALLREFTSKGVNG
ncbi:hypothetical protein GCM10011409_18740 [Lentibacillus populi]|uniref:DnaD domain-containing protein n=1 Tax=Lentibacillus populi TaxID=1827502 RepID=A0A9W5X5B9_9BACI|nr:replication protein [Lentibacillus populi]GGB41459.1 hypothetical protein GCM10011409_18740 [Lentibacillus populi]